MGEQNLWPSVVDDDGLLDGSASPFSERWPTWQENDYESGGICNAIGDECKPMEDKIKPKMLYLQVTVDDRLQVTGGAFDAPEPLQTKLDEIVDQIRTAVEDHRRASLALCDSDSDSHSPLQHHQQQEHLPRAADGLIRSAAESPHGYRAAHAKCRAHSLDPSLTHVRSSSFLRPDRPAIKRQAPSDGADSGDDVINSAAVTHALHVGDSNHSQDSTGILPTADEKIEERRKRVDDSDPEAKTIRNVTLIKLKDHARLREYYHACFKRIQQTACRQIAQVFVKVVHPKKQTSYPYNGNKRSSRRPTIHLKLDGYVDDSIPHWWPKDVPHKEPAHMKTPDRMELLLHILCCLKDMKGTGPKRRGVRVQDLKAATDKDKTMSEFGKRVDHWLKDIYRVREAQERSIEGSAVESVTVHWPSNKRLKRETARQRQKTDEDGVEEDDELARFHTGMDDAMMESQQPDPYERVTRDGQPYAGSSDEEEVKSTCSWPPSLIADTPATMADDEMEYERRVEPEKKARKALANKNFQEHVHDSRHALPPCCHSDIEARIEALSPDASLFHRAIAPRPTAHSQPAPSESQTAAPEEEAPPRVRPAPPLPPAQPGSSDKRAPHHLSSLSTGSSFPDPLYTGSSARPPIQQSGHLHTTPSRPTLSHSSHSSPSHIIAPSAAILSSRPSYEQVALAPQRQRQEDRTEIRQGPTSPVRVLNPIDSRSILHPLNTQTTYGDYRANHSAWSPPQSSTASQNRSMPWSPDGTDQILSRPWSRDTAVPPPPPLMLPASLPSKNTSSSMSPQTPPYVSPYGTKPGSPRSATRVAFSPVSRSRSGNGSFSHSDALETQMESVRLAPLTHLSGVSTAPQNLPPPPAPPQHLHFFPPGPYQPFHHQQPGQHLQPSHQHHFQHQQHQHQR